MRLILAGLILGIFASAAPSSQAPTDNDHTMQAMRDEMARSKGRLELQIPPSGKSAGRGA